MFFTWKFKKSKLWETPVNQHSQSGPFLLHFHGNKWCEELIPKGTIGQNRQLSGSLSFFVPCILWWQEGAKVRAHVINRGCTICKDIKVNLVQCVHVTRLKGFLFLRKLWTEPHPGAVPFIEYEFSEARYGMNEKVVALGRRRVGVIKVI